METIGYFDSVRSAPAASWETQRIGIAMSHTRLTETSWPHSWR
jgi:hypothetical protein